MEEPVVKVEGVHKKFCRSLKRSMAYAGLDVSRSMLGIPYRTDVLRKDEFWALQNVNFELRKGETLGIIGTNGSGKSTLLRLLTGILPPDQGKIEVTGSVGALIAVGAGFHPHMTGRENIYLNGTILGMNRQQIDERFDEIIDFADIGEFIDAPISTYSSGMKVRLGFSVAVHVKPDILLVDEILSVGDLSFRNKSLRKMQEYRAQANAIIFISHNLEQVRMLCDRLIILNKGEVIYDGRTHDGIVHYEELTRESRVRGLRKNALSKSSLAIRRRANSGQDVEIIDLSILNADNQKADAIGMSDPLIFSYEFKTSVYIKSLYFSCGILNEELKPCIWLVSNDNNRAKFENLVPGIYRLVLHIGKHSLVPNVYIPNIAIRNGDTAETYERLLPNLTFRVRSNGVALERGIVAVKEEWKLEKVSNTAMVFL